MSSIRKHLLIIDDAEDNLEVFRIILAKHYTVSACTSCSSGMEVLRQNPVHVLLMDIAMSHVDGIECLARIRATPEFRNIPAIAITAYAYEADRQVIEEVLARPDR